LEDFIQSLSAIHPLWVYVIVFFIAYIENILPPFPSDAVVVFGGSLVAIGQGSFLIALCSATSGSTLGFLTMFFIGRWFGRRIIESGKLPFIPLDTLHKAEQWFARYGYNIVIANRFLAGTRAIVSFFAGISNLRTGKTFALSFVSSLAWNSILVYAGFVLGENWEIVGLYLSTYSQIVTAIIILIIVFFILRYFYTRNKAVT
jgi:membrane protein DedA with SNARE-associated domain